MYKTCDSCRFKGRAQYRKSGGGCKSRGLHHSKLGNGQKRCSQCRRKGREQYWKNVEKRREYGREYYCKYVKKEAR